VKSKVFDYEDKWSFYFKLSYFTSLGCAIFAFFFRSLPDEIISLTAFVSLFNELSTKSFDESYVSDVFGLTILFNLLLLCVFLVDRIRTKHVTLTDDNLNDAMLYFALNIILLAFLFVVVFAPTVSLPSVAEMHSSRGLFLRTNLGTMMYAPVFSALLFLAFAASTSMTVSFFKSFSMLIDDIFTKK